MGLLNLDKKVIKLVLDIVDKKLGKLKIAGIPIDKITDVFQGQENKIKDLEREIEAIKSILKENNE